jgi:hypothetical protein
MKSEVAERILNKKDPGTDDWYRAQLDWINALEAEGRAHDGHVGLKKHSLEMLRQSKVDKFWNFVFMIAGYVALGIVLYTVAQDNLKNVVFMGFLGIGYLLYQILKNLESKRGK